LISSSSINHQRSIIMHFPSFLNFAFLLRLVQLIFSIVGIILLWGYLMAVLFCGGIVQQVNITILSNLEGLKPFIHIPVEAHFELFAVSPSQSITNIHVGFIWNCFRSCALHFIYPRTSQYKTLLSSRRWYSLFHITTNHQQLLNSWPQSSS